MKCWPWRKIANIALGILFVGLFASLAMPAVYEICGPSEYTHAKECTQYHLPQWIFVGAVGIGDAHNGLIIAIATGLLTWITWRLSRMEAESGEATKAELRAYVSATIKAISMAADGVNLSALVRIHNSGQTPAFKTIAPGYFAIRLPPYEFEIADGLEGNVDQNSIITFDLPKDGGRTATLTRKFSDAELVNMKAPKARFYVFGLIGYHDVFGAEMSVEFCGYMDGPAFVEAYEIAKTSPREKVEGPFKIASFGQDTNFDPTRRTKKA